MRAGRLVSMLLLLQQRGGMTAERLARELGVSVRTVYRDAEALAAAGIPIYGESGHAGGYRLLDGYRTKLTGLTEGEAEALALSGVPAAAVDLGLQTELAALELKLSAAMPQAQRERAEEAKRLFHLDVVGWFRRAEPVPFLALAANAAWERRRLQVRYSRWAEPKEVERELCPLGLVLKGGQWYLVATVEDGPARMYKVTNLLAAKKTDKTFERPDDFDLAAWWARQLDDFDARRYQGEALVRLSPDAVAKAPDNLDADSVAAIAEGTVEPDGWTVATIPIETHAHAAGELLRLGGVEVLEPATLRTLIRELATEAAALHT
ncbi:helix-turn-helix transcriptional regulator [Glycomyces niveus]|uniref:WYL domain-containing protein n=1 Tax=Glycomyces niveus TaxID=2820287 RepID=A0ABS3TYA1_9ACTN|nr:WYL domain-containing protein [Glycomyces sp. NEAU-S30]MBO3731488.1 WYL domain-containing protein [Glycomyces sp. NEAU-S30]